MPKTRGIIESALYVDDMTRSVEFYHHLFGFEILNQGRRLSALRVFPNQVLLLFQKGMSKQATIRPFGTIPPTDGDGNLHLTFAVTPSALQEWEDILKKRQIRIESKLSWPTGGESIYFRDPDGHLLELKTADWDSPIEFD